MATKLADGPQPGHMGRPNAVSAFFHQWRQWRAEAEQLVAGLEPGLAEDAAGAS